MDIAIGGRPGAPLFALWSYTSGPGFGVCVNLPFGPWYLSWLISFVPDCRGFYLAPYRAGRRWWGCSGGGPFHSWQIDFGR